MRFMIFRAMHFPLRQLPSFPNLIHGCLISAPTLLYFLVAHEHLRRTSKLDLLGFFNIHSTNISQVSTEWQALF